MSTTQEPPKTSRHPFQPWYTLVLPEDFLPSAQSFPLCPVTVLSLCVAVERRGEDLKKALDEVEAFFARSPVGLQIVLPWVRSTPCTLRLMFEGSGT